MKRLVRTVALAGLLFGLAPAGAASPAPPLEPLLERAGLAGAVVVRVDGDTATVSAHGLAHVSERRPMHDDSRVHVGSVAKPMLALAVLRLVTLGRLSLDDEVQRWLPALPLHNPWHGSHPLRVRHLLDHTGGLDDVRLWHLFNRHHPPRMALARAYADHPAMLRLRFAPGTRMSYSNLGYTLAGQVIEAVTDEAYEAWGDRELLRPLGMNDSSFEATTQTGPHADPRLAWGHLDDGTPLAAMPLAVRPAAQFTTTAADMGRLLRFLMGDGRIDGATFIDARWLRAMGRPVGTDAAQAGLRQGYALGLARGARDGAAGLCHEGSIAGFRAMLCLYPDERRGYFVGLNSDTEDGGHRAVYAALVGSLGLRAPEPAPAPGPATAADDVGWLGRYVPAPGRMQAYALADLLAGSRILAQDPGGLSWSRGANVQRLVPTAPRLYRVADAAEAGLVLLKDEEGRPIVSSGLSTYRRIAAASWWAAWAAVGAGAAGALAWLVLPVWQRARHRQPLARAGFFAVLGLILAVAAVAATGWAAMGERHAANQSLTAATALLPAAMSWELVRAARAGWPRGSRALSAAAAGVLLACGLLAWHGLLPLALWR